MIHRKDRLKTGIIKRGLCDSCVTDAVLSLIAYRDEIHQHDQKNCKYFYEGEQ